MFDTLGMLKFAVSSKIIKNYQKLSKIINSGNVTDLTAQFNFEYETGAFLSCSTVQNGIMFVFGGYFSYDYKDQISIVEDCRLRRVGTLPMRFQEGACNSFTTGEGKQVSMLCFGEDDPSACHT